MAQIESTPLLSICIPIYNRLSYLERMLDRFFEEKELFESRIELYISDNCSEDDLQSCCSQFKERGLKLNYHRNDTNLGMDGNFINCFKSANGKYVWLLGSDDIPQRGRLKAICEILSTHSDYGLLHLAGEKSQENEPLVEVNNGSALLEELHVWITFISGNIVNREFVKEIDFDKYRGTLISQVPLYIHSLVSSQTNAIYYANVFEIGSDSANNGGYNIFQVFVDNLFCIFRQFMSNKKLSRTTFEKIEKLEYKEFLVDYIVRLLIFRKHSNFNTKDAWKILRKYYIAKPYAYYYLFTALLKHYLRSLLKYCKRM